MVLEGLLCVPTYREERRMLRVPVEVLDDPDNWIWSQTAIKSLQDKIYRLSMFLDVVTFEGSAVADAAAEWFQRYDIGVSGVEHCNFESFCTSLAWRQDIHTIYEASPQRIQRYGQRGYAVVGGVFEWISSTAHSAASSPIGISPPPSTCMSAPSTSRIQPTCGCGR